MKDLSRRDFIKVVVAGAASTCPRSLGAQDSAAHLSSSLSSDEFSLCHAIRDGLSPAVPPPERTHQVVIIGGGPSGLTAGFRLRDDDILVLEKEPRPGGNAITEQWEGVAYSTGVAYDGSPDSPLGKIFSEAGVELKEIESIDASIIQAEVVPEFWGGGIERSPYPESVRKSFRQLQKDMLAVDLESSREKLDQITFAELLRPYAPEVKLWFDNFGPNNWGADTENTSAYIGAESLRWAGGLAPRRSTFPGGLGVGARALAGRIEESGPGRLVTGATVFRVEQKTEDRVEVSYFLAGEPHTVSARAVICAAPKFISKRIVAGLPDGQRRAMERFRYAPYPVVNVCSRGVIYDASYDTNIPAPSLIVDFNVADWLVYRGRGPRDRPSVLTCYVPLPESRRAELQMDEQARRLGLQVVDQLEEWFPGARRKVEEVRVYRRGHPMFMAAPGVLSRWAPEASRPLGRIFFAGADSLGGVSEFSSAAEAAETAVREVKEVLAASPSLVSP